VLLLALGMAIELVGLVVLVWQELDVYTIDGSITLTMWGAMLVGVALVWLGFSRLMRSTGGRPALLLAVAGAGAGAMLLSSALAWQVLYGLIPSGNLDLEVYATLPLFFVGVASLTISVGAQRVPSSSSGEGDTAGSAASPRSTAGLLGPPAAVLVLGAALLVSLGAGAPSLDSRAAAINSLYQFVALELAAGGVWLLLSGTSALLRLVPAVGHAGVRRAGRVAGLAFILAGAALWWWTAPLAYALSEIITGGFLLAGVGLILMTTRKTPMATRGVPPRSPGATLGDR
jgi:hypothetical protein